MKRKILAFLLSMVMAVVACCVLGGQPAYAEEPATSETPESGNLTVVEQGTNGGTLEFYQVKSKKGNTFYIIIDRTQNTENVYFLNQVDEADLMALIGSDDIQPSEKECICESKCTVGNINTDCPVCAANMTECFGTEEQGQEQEQTKPERTPSPVSTDASEGDQNIQIPQQALYAIPVVIVVLFIATAVVVKKRKSKKATVEDESDDEYVFEDDDEDEDADIEEK